MSTKLTDVLLDNYGQAAKDWVLALYPHEDNRAENSQLAELFDRFSPADLIGDKPASKANFAVAIKNLLECRTEAALKEKLESLRAFMKEDEKKKEAVGNDLGNKADLLAELAARRLVVAALQLAPSRAPFTPAQQQLLTIPAVKEKFSKTMGRHSSVDNLNHALTALTGALANVSTNKPALKAELKTQLGLSDDDLRNLDIEKALQAAVVEHQVDLAIETDGFTDEQRTIINRFKGEFLKAMTDRALAATPPKTGTAVVDEVKAQLQNLYVKHSIEELLGLKNLTQDDWDTLLNQQYQKVDAELHKAGQVLDPAQGANTPFINFLNSHQATVRAALLGKTPEEAKNLLAKAKAAFGKAVAAKPNFDDLSTAFSAIGLKAVADRVHKNKSDLQKERQLLPKLKEVLLQKVFAFNFDLVSEGRNVLMELHRAACFAAQQADPAGALRGALSAFAELTEGDRNAIIEQLVEVDRNNGVVPRKEYLRAAYTQDGMPNTANPFHKSAATFVTQSAEPPALTPALTYESVIKQVFVNISAKTQLSGGKDKKTVEEFLDHAFDGSPMQRATTEQKRIIWDEIHALINKPEAVPLLFATEDERVAKRDQVTNRMETFINIARKEAKAKLKAYRKDFPENKKKSTPFLDALNSLIQAASTKELELPIEANENRLLPGGVYDQVVAKRDEVKAHLDYINRILQAADLRRALGVQVSDESKAAQMQLAALWREMNARLNQMDAVIHQLNKAKEKFARGEKAVVYSAATLVEAIEIDENDYESQLREINRVFGLHRTESGGLVNPNVMAGLGVAPVEPSATRGKRTLSAGDLQGAAPGKQKVPFHIVKVQKEVTENVRGKEQTVNKDVAVGGFYETQSFQTDPRNNQTVVAGTVQRTFLAPNTSEEDRNAVMKAQAAHLAASFQKMGGVHKIYLNCDYQLGSFEKTDNKDAMDKLYKHLLAHGVPDSMIEYPKGMSKPNWYLGEAGAETRMIKKTTTEVAKARVNVLRGEVPEAEQPYMPPAPKA